MIVNLTENRFLQQVQKIELINWDWDWLEIHYALRGNPFQKCTGKVIYCQEFFFIFEFELAVLFAFSHILGDAFMVSTLTP